MENDGEQNFTSYYLFNVEILKSVLSIVSLDFDMDGDIDILTGFTESALTTQYTPGSLFLYINNNIQSHYKLNYFNIDNHFIEDFDRHFVETTLDFDNDGDIDFISEAVKPYTTNSHSQITWLENIDGN